MMTDESIYPEGITPEMLMAYADGVLDGDDALRVKAALDAYPELADEVAAYRTTSSLMATAFDAPLEEPIPDHLAALIMGGSASADNVTSLHAERQRRTLSLPVWGQAMAACAVFALGAVFGTTLLAGRPSGTDAEMLLAGRLSAAHPLAKALETTESAKTVKLSGGRFEAVASFPTASGETCREFETANASGALVGLACRRSGSWTIELLLRAESSESPGGGFELASGIDTGVIDAVLKRLDTGIGHSLEQEKCLIAAGWDASACRNVMTKE